MSTSRHPTPGDPVTVTIAGRDVPGVVADTPDWDPAYNHSTLLVPVTVDGADYRVPLANINA